MDRLAVFDRLVNLRDSMRARLGDDYSAKMEPLTNLIASAMEVEGVPALEAVQVACSQYRQQRGKDMPMDSQWALIAAAVDIVETEYRRAQLEDSLKSLGLGSMEKLNRAHELWTKYRKN